MATRKRQQRSQVPTVDYSALEEAVSVMPSKMLLCRDLGHAWVSYTAQRGEGGRGFEATMRCSRACGATKTRHIDGDGYIMGSKFHYDDQSYVLKGYGRPTRGVRALMRLTSLERLAK